jgi:hypothetical protein
MSTDYYIVEEIDTHQFAFASVPWAELQARLPLVGLTTHQNHEGDITITDGDDFVHINIHPDQTITSFTRFGGNYADDIIAGLASILPERFEIISEHSEAFEALMD